MNLFGTSCDWVRCRAETVFSVRSRRRNRPPDSCGNEQRNLRARVALLRCAVRRNVLLKVHLDFRGFLSRCIATEVPALSGSSMTISYGQRVKSKSGRSLSASVRIE